MRDRGPAVDTLPAERMLSVEQARAFYDAFGAKQDGQAFYEDPPNRDMIAHCALDSARAVFELGCGTGRLAADLLESVLPNDCTYTAVDLSDTMVDLARERTRSFAPRVSIDRTDGALPLPFPDGSFDRFLSTYVFDLLPRPQIERVIAEAHRLLGKDGRLGLTSLTCGQTPLTRGVTWLWRKIHARAPQRVGGCRPIDLEPFLPPELWAVERVHVIAARGLASQVIVARRS